MAMMTIGTMIVVGTRDVLELLCEAEVDSRFCEPLDDELEPLCTIYVSLCRW